ncbi:hypothetical protein ILYODFUR_022437 [Ilyodon furcidens]|uniref:Uncharacterized protein n=1 Tax=Ilyodon furcidens TaxID=33524 RepID=A0ABV0TA87_9TELE
MSEGKIEEILEVLFPPPNDVPSRGQQLPAPSVNSVGEALLFTSLGARLFAGIASRPTDSPSPWPHRTPPRPEFLPLLQPGPQHAWPHGTRQPPRESHKPAIAVRTPSSA